MSDEIKPAPAGRSLEALELVEAITDIIGCASGDFDRAAELLAACMENKHNAGWNAGVEATDEDAIVRLLDLIEEAHRLITHGECALCCKRLGVSEHESECVYAHHVESREWLARVEGE